MNILILALLVVAFLSGFFMIPVVGARLSYSREITRTLMRARETPGEWVADCSENRPAFIAVLLFFLWLTIGFWLVGLSLFIAIPVFFLTILLLCSRYQISFLEYPGPDCAWSKLYRMDPGRFEKELTVALERNDLPFEVQEAGKHGIVWPPRSRVRIEEQGTEGRRALVYFRYASQEMDGTLVTQLQVEFFDWTTAAFRPLMDGNIRKRFIDIVDENIKEVYVPATT